MRETFFLGDSWMWFLKCEKEKTDQTYDAIWKFLAFLGGVVLIQCEPVASQHPSNTLCVMLTTFLKSSPDSMLAPQWSLTFHALLCCILEVGVGSCKKCVILDPYIRLYAASSVTKSSMAYPEIAIRNAEKWEGNSVSWYFDSVANTYLLRVDWKWWWLYDSIGLSLVKKLLANLGKYPKVNLKLISSFQDFQFIPHEFGP